MIVEPTRSEPGPTASTGDPMGDSQHYCQRLFLGSLTRARLVPAQLAAEVGHVDVPEPLDTSGEPERVTPPQPA